MKYLHLLLALGALLAPCAEAQTLKVAYHGQADSPSGQALELFQNEVSKCTSDELTVDLFLDRSLGSPFEVVEAVAEGTIDLAVIPSSTLQRFSKEAGIFSVPFVFNNRTHWETALRQGLVDLLNEELESNGSIRILSFLGGQIFGVASSQPIQTLADFQGKKVRAFGEGGQLFASLGASPVSMSFGEVITALQAGAIDSAEVLASSSVRSGTFKAFKNFTRTNHRITTEFFIVNRNTIDGLEERNQNCIIFAARESELRGLSATGASELLALEIMRESGVKILRIEDQRAIFEAAQPSRDELISRLGVGAAFELTNALGACASSCTRDQCGEGYCDMCFFCP